jgi:hypothetical protein
MSGAPAPLYGLFHGRDLGARPPKFPLISGGSCIFVLVQGTRLSPSGPFQKASSTKFCSVSSDFNLYPNFASLKISQLQSHHNASPINTPRNHPSNPHNPLLHLHSPEHHLQAMGLPRLLRRARCRNLSRPGDNTFMDHLPLSLLDLRAWSQCHQYSPQSPSLHKN